MSNSFSVFLALARHVLPVQKENSKYIYIKHSDKIRTHSSELPPPSVKSINSTAKISSSSSIPISSKVWFASIDLPLNVKMNCIGGLLGGGGEEPECCGLFAVSDFTNPFLLLPNSLVLFTPNLPPAISIRSVHDVINRETFVLRDILKNNSALYRQLTLTTISGVSRYLVSFCFALSVRLDKSAFIRRNYCRLPSQ